MRPARLVPAALVLVAAACGAPAPPQVSRSEAVQASGVSPDPKRWCDVFYTGADAPRLALPKVAAARPGAPVPSLPADRWVWVNLWATWCGPCRREMPLVLAWSERLAREGRGVDLWFVSVDERQEDLARFLADNPGVAPGNSVRLAQPGGLARWLAAFPGAPTDAIPLQVIAAPGGRVRCVRAGALRDGDFPVVEALLRQ